MKKALVVPAKGIGDALLMMIASYQLKQAGFQVTTAHSVLWELSAWFPEQFFSRGLPDHLHTFDLICIENDNSLQMHRWKADFPQAAIFYPSYSPHKNPPLSQKDAIFNTQLTMAENIAIATAGLLKEKSPLSTENGITPPGHLIPRKNLDQVVIHPTSSHKQKNWSKARYLKLYHLLQKKGFSPFFVTSPEERADWAVDAPLFPTLAHLAEAVYESGYMIGNDSLVGHLASNLNIPHLIIADDHKRMDLWRPGWRKGLVITPHPWVPNCKFLRLRQKRWQCFISTRRVLDTFEQGVLPSKRASQQ